MTENKNAYDALLEVLERDPAAKGMVDRMVEKINRIAGPMPPILALIALKKCLDVQIKRPKQKTTKTRTGGRRS